MVSTAYKTLLCYCSYQHFNIAKSEEIKNKLHVKGPRVCKKFYKFWTYAFLKFCHLMWDIKPRTDQPNLICVAKQCNVILYLPPRKNCFVHVFFHRCLSMNEWMSRFTNQIKVCHIQSFNSLFFLCVQGRGVLFQQQTRDSFVMC